MISCEIKGCFFLPQHLAIETLSFTAANNRSVKEPQITSISSDEKQVSQGTILRASHKLRYIDKKTDS